MRSSQQRDYSEAGCLRRAALHRAALDDKILSVVRAKVGDDAIALLWRTERRTGADVPVFVSMNPETQDKLLALGLEIA